MRQIFDSMFDSFQTQKMTDVPGPSVDLGIGRPRKRKIRPAPLTLSHLTQIQKFRIEVELDTFEQSKIHIVSRFMSSNIVYSKTSL